MSINKKGKFTYDENHFSSAEIRISNEFDCESDTFDTLKETKEHLIKEGHFNCTIYVSLETLQTLFLTI